VKQTFFAYVNHARIRTWNQPVLSIQRKPLMGLKPRLIIIHRLRVRHIEKIELAKTITHRYNHT